MMMIETWSERYVRLALAPVWKILASQVKAAVNLTNIV
jgi:hypothetical protein